MKIIKNIKKIYKLSNFTYLIKNTSHFSYLTNVLYSKALFRIYHDYFSWVVEYVNQWQFNSLKNKNFKLDP